MTAKVTITIPTPVSAAQLRAILAHASALAPDVSVDTDPYGKIRVELGDVWPALPLAPAVFEDQAPVDGASVFAIAEEMGDDGYAEPDPDLPKWTHQPDRPLLGIDRPLRCKDQPDDGDAVTSAVSGSAPSDEAAEPEVEGPLDDEEQANARAAEDWSFLGRTDRADRDAATEADPEEDPAPARGAFGPDTIAWDVLTLLADDLAGTWEGSIGDLADEIGRGSRAGNGAIIRKLGDAGLVQIVRTSPRRVSQVCLTRAGWDHLGRTPRSSGIDGFTITPPTATEDPVDLTAPPMQARGRVDVDAARARAAEAAVGW